MKVCKLLQKQTYNILSHKYYVICFLFLVFTTLISLVHLCEVWLNGMMTKDEKLLLTYLVDNIGGISLEKRVCQYLPIDVVYTWVNGSDPLLQIQLNEHRVNLKLDLSRTCPYNDCLPSHYTVVRINSKHIKAKLSGDNDEYLLVSTNTTILNSQQPLSATRRQQLWKLYRWDSPDEATKQLIATSNSGNSLEDDDNYNYLHQPHWTTDEAASNLYSPKDFLMLKFLPISKIKLTKPVVNKSLLSSWLENRVKLFWVYSEANVVVVVVQLQKPFQSVFKVKSSGNTRWKIIKVDSSYIINVTEVHLALELPLNIKQSDYAPSRFDDKEELRYSLRSLEKYAPWVRKIYLVTNGQIPHWLNLENPRISIVQHRVIFNNESHLPTFSSPAIETHLHRIPGLSQKFLYLNDDLLIGSEVWPDDFVSPHLGQKVYLSWPVPDCNNDCPWLWVGNGVCDKPCNISACDYDGGDCNEMFDSEHENNVIENKNFNIHEHHQDDWNNQEVYDDGLNKNELRSKRDVNYMFNKSSYDKNYGVLSHKINQSLSNVNVNFKQLTFYKFLHCLKLCDSYENNGYYINNKLSLNLINYYCDIVYKNYMRRYIDKNTSHKLLRIFFYNGCYKNVFNRGQFDLNKHKYDKNNSCNYCRLRFNFKNNNIRIRRSAFNFQPKKGLSDINVNAPGNQTNLSSITDVHINKYNDSLTRYQSIMLRKLSPKLLVKQLKNFDGSTISKKVDHIHNHMHHDDANDMTFSSRKLDTFAESLLHVNRLYNKVYGYKPRKVPAHMPHLIDKSVMSELQNRFKEEYAKTSSHHIRSPDDMQFAFSYFYFLMSEQEMMPIAELFDTFDTDNSGTWSDREIRTVMTRLFPLPLHQNSIMEFEKYLKECSLSSPLTDNAIEKTQPPFERYLGSTLPLITKELVSGCDNLLRLMNNTFSYRNKYPFTIIKHEQFVGFHMINSNLSELLYTLDKIRHNPKKFLCLNDNMDPARTSDNELSRAVLLDFYHSLFPKPSQFELSAEYRNRFLYYDEYMSWKLRHSIITSLITFTILLLGIVTFSFLFNREIFLILRRTFAFFNHNLIMKKKYHSRHTHKI